MEQNIHNGHRNRLRKLLTQVEFKSLDEYSQLEYILTLIVPRKNTNDIAHLLLDKFESLQNVFGADIDELLKVKNVGIRTAEFLHYLPSLNIYLKSIYESNEEYLKTKKQVVEFIAKEIVKEKKEVFMAIALSKTNKILGVLKQKSDSSLFVNPNYKELAQFLLSKNAYQTIIGHNHPSGIAISSKEDVKTTSSIKTTLEMLGIKHLDSIIVSETNFFSYEDNNIYLYSDFQININDFI